ncbi:MAG: DUF11 domain-containing protein [Clostridiales bacterium]|nr:DUF11 domain-containing protein [Clostridiales bacterium]
MGWVIENVAPYSGATVSLTVVVNEEALTAGEADNSAHVTIGDNAYTTNVTINHVDDDPQDPTKEIDVGEDAELTAGEQYTYTITYYNHLGTAATVTITDELDDNLTFVSASDGGEEVDGVVTWVIEDVDPYATGSVTLTVEVNDDATGTITNTAIVQIADGDPTDTSTTTTTEDTNTVENTIEEEESETTTSSSSSSKSSTPKTGDTFRLTLWVLLLAGSAAGLLVLYFRRKSSDDAE